MVFLAFAIFYVSGELSLSLSLYLTLTTLIVSIISAGILGIHLRHSTRVLNRPLRHDRGLRTRTARVLWVPTKFSMFVILSLRVTTQRVRRGKLETTITNDSGVMLCL